jgi:hypothetical protein
VLQYVLGALQIEIKVNISVNDILGGQSNYATLASWKISQRTISSEALPEFILQIVRKNLTTSENKMN